MVCLFQVMASSSQTVVVGKCRQEEEVGEVPLDRHRYMDPMSHQLSRAAFEEAGTGSKAHGRLEAEEMPSAPTTPSLAPYWCFTTVFMLL